MAKKKKAATTRRGRPPGSKNKSKPAPSTASSEGDLLAAIKFVQSCGGIEEAKRLIRQVENVKKALG